MKLDLYAGIEAALWDEDQGQTSPIQLISHTLLQQPKATSKTKRKNRVPDIVKWHPEIVVVDEAHKFKTYGSAQTKGLMKILKLTRPAKRLAMTATPTLNIDPEELRPQLLFVDESLLTKYGVADWVSFRKRFCKLETMYMGGMTVDKVVGVKNQNILDEITSQIAIRQDASVLNLPDGVFAPTYYAMGSKAARLYKKMGKEGSILEKDLEVITSNALDRAIRCFEIRSGFVKDFEGKFHDLDDTLISVTMELARNTPLPLLIVYRFRHTGDRLEEALAKEGLRVGHIRGGVSAPQKSAIEQKFQAGGYDVVLGQYAAVSLGLTFTRGNQIIFAEPTFSLEEWIQTLGRIRRRGQTKTCFYRQIIAKSSADRECYDSLENKEDFADKLTNGLIRLG